MGGARNLLWSVVVVCDARICNVTHQRQHVTAGQ